MIRRTRCISFPRSGHHLLVDLLVLYLGDDLVYADRYGSHDIHGKRVDKTPGSPGHCVPCSFKDNPQANLEKNHDYDLDIPHDLPVIVQTRPVLDSIISWYNFQVDEAATEDSQIAWETFAESAARFRIGFDNKWVLPMLDQAVLIDYNDLVGNPRFTLHTVLSFLGIEVDDNRINEVLCSMKIQRRNTVDSFRWYDPDFYNRILKTVDLGLNRAPC